MDDRDVLMEREREVSRTWEGRVGRRHFRVQWDQKPGAARLRFQAPFDVDDDPDGVGVPFSSDLGVVWERGRRAHLFGKYAERLNKLQREAPEALERVVGDMETALAALREELNKRAASIQSSEKSAVRSQPQRVRIEIESTTDPLDEDLDESDEDEIVPSTSVNGERDMRRRAILEEFRAGTITLEETEARLNALG
jgi:hypothetical protein